jgi:hypothetical protein
MFSVGEDVEADALFKRGWTVSAIARHSAVTARRSGPTSRANGPRGSAVRPSLIRSTSTGPT